MAQVKEKFNDTKQFYQDWWCWVLATYGSP